MYVKELIFLYVLLKNLAYLSKISDFVSFKEKLTW